MMKNKIKLMVTGILMIALQNCNSNQQPKTVTAETVLGDSSQAKRDSPITFYDSLNIYAELKAKVYNIDSIMVSVDIINDSGDSVWLYKPVLPSDSLVEETFYVKREDNNENLPHIYKLTDHRYLAGGGQGLLPSIKPVINDSNLLVLFPHTRKTFITNLAKHYNLRELDREKVKTLFINYGMDFPYIKNNKHVYLKNSFYPYWDKEFKPAYIDISIKKRNKDAPPDFDELVRVVLPEK